MSKIEEIIEKLKNFLRDTPMSGGIVRLEELEAELTKTKKLHEIFVNNEPNDKELLDWIDDVGGCFLIRRYEDKFSMHQYEYFTHLEMIDNQSCETYSNIRDLIRKAKEQTNM